MPSGEAVPSLDKNITDVAEDFNRQKKAKQDEASQLQNWLRTFSSSNTPAFFAERRLLSSILANGSNVGWTCFPHPLATAVACHKLSRRRRYNSAPSWGA